MLTSTYVCKMYIYICMGLYMYVSLHMYICTSVCLTCSCTCVCTYVWATVSVLEAVSPLLLQLDTAPSFLPKGVSYPLLLDASVAKGRFSFAPPSAVKVVGSWLLRTHFCRQFSVDLAIEIPEVCVGGRE